MATIKPIELVPSIASPYKDSRAEGYVSYYTKAGWDRWNQAAAQIEQDVKDRKLKYDAAIELYKSQLKDISDEKQALTSKLAGIQLKQADVKARREEAVARMEEARIRQKQAQETAKAQKEAVTPSSKGAYSGGGRGSSFLAKDPLDIAMDNITPANRTLVDDRLRTLGSGITTANLGTKLTQLQQMFDNGSLPADEYTRSITAYALINTAINEIAAKEKGGDKSQAQIAVTSALGGNPSIRTYVNTGKSKVDAIAAQQGTPAGGASAGGFRGAEQGPYDIAAYEKEVAKLGTDLEDYRAIESGLKADIAKQEGKSAALIKPTLEPIDMITAARKEYIRKFNDIPRGATLKLGSETIADYKDLMPFEVANAMSRTSDFFKMYINDSITSAKRIAGRELTTDELNQAVEDGKLRARNVLFGEVYTPQEKQTIEAGGKVNPYAKIEADTAAARASGILPEADKIMEEVDKAVDLSGVKLTRPPKVESEYAKLFRDRINLGTGTAAESPNVDIGAMLEAQRQRIESDDLRRRSMEGERRAPSFEYKPEGEISAVPMPTPSITESMLGRKPISISELPPSMNKLDRAALGIPDTVGTPVGSEVLGGDMGAAGRKREQLKKALEDLKKKRELPQEQKDFLKEAGEVTKPKEGATLDQKDTQAKSQAVIAGATLAQENPKAAASAITKDSMGKYIASLYDENKLKGPRAASINDLTSTVISEYAGDDKKQKKAVELLTQLAYLDQTSNKIKPA